MESVYETIKSIAAYLILVTVLINLVNGSSYKKYVQLVSGMILILIVLVPLTGFMSLDDSFHYQFELSDFEIKMREEGVFKEAEEIKEQKMKEEYKKFLKAKIDTIVALEGREAEYTEILLNEEDYGVIEEIVVRVSAEKLEEEKLKETEGEKVEYVSIEPVEIDIYENDNAKEAVMEKNKVTETIRKEIASAFAMKEERIMVYQEER